MASLCVDRCILKPEDPNTDQIKCRSTTFLMLSTFFFVGSDGLESCCHLSSFGLEGDIPIYRETLTLNSHH